MENNFVVKKSRVKTFAKLFSNPDFITVSIF